MAGDTSLLFVHFIFFAKGKDSNSSGPVLSRRDSVGPVVVIELRFQQRRGRAGASRRLQIINIPAHSPEGQFSGNTSTNVLAMKFQETRLKKHGKV
jgi:hypothetical protein